MKPAANIAIVAVAVTSLAISLIAILKKPAHVPAGEKSPTRAETLSGLPRETSTAAFERRLDLLEATLGRVNDPDTAPPEGDGPQFSSIDARLSGIESSLENLQSAFNGISLEQASADRDELFRSEEGYLKADEYFAVGKHAIAGEGYLKFLEAHPDHPDAYDILGRARDAFRRAGYMDKAIWAQQELIKNRGEALPADLNTLASLEKLHGRYGDAAKHVAQAADMLEGTERLWGRMYWAWYTQLGEGADAGLAAYRNVEAEITASGYTEHKLGTRVREKIAELERLQAGAP